MYVEDDRNIAEIYITMIKERFPGLEIVHHENGIKALQELKESPERFRLIISDFNLSNMTGGQIFSFVNRQMLGIPFIILSGLDCSKDHSLSNFFNSYVRNALLLKPVSINELTEKIEWCLEGEADLLKIFDVPLKNYDEKIPVRSDTFLKVNSVPCDIYIKLNDGKFVKIIKQQDIFETQLVQRLIMKGVSHLFVNRSELSTYGESVLSALYGLLRSKKHKNDELQKSQLASKAIELIKNNLIKCGFNPSVLKVADEVTNLQIEMIKDSPELSDFLTRFQNFRRINTDHTRLISYIVVVMLEDLSWDSESTLQKMCTAALLHDFSMSDELIEKVSLGTMLSNLNEEEKRIYLRHPEESSHVAKHFESMTAGIVRFILEHHELPNGKGFPRKMNYNNVHPLSAVLHLADLTADLLWKTEFDVFKVKEELSILRSFYLRGFYRRPYEALMNSLKNCKN